MPRWTRLLIPESHQLSFLASELPKIFFSMPDGKHANIITRFEGDISHTMAWKPNQHIYEPQKSLPKIVLKPFFHFVCILHIREESSIQHMPLLLQPLTGLPRAGLCCMADHFLLLEPVSLNSQPQNLFSQTVPTLLQTPWLVPPLQPILLRLHADDQLLASVTDSSWPLWSSCQASQLLPLSPNCASSGSQRVLFFFFFLWWWRLNPGSYPC